MSAPVRRMTCAVCGSDAGRWWYWSRSNPGRTPVYATPDCYNRWRRMDRRQS